MRTPIRAAIGSVISVAALSVAITSSASAAGGTSIPPDTPVTSPPSVGHTCVVQHPDCNDIGFGGGGGSVPPAKAQLVEPRPGMANVMPIAYDRATIADDDVTLTIRFWSGVEPCAVLDHVDVQQDPDVVVVTLYQGNDPSAGDVACPDLATLKQVSVDLTEPLAGRDIVDGAAP
jgi:hypothetical protein